MKWCGLPAVGLIMLAVSLPAFAQWNADAVGNAIESGNAEQALAATQDRLAKKPDDPKARFLHAMAEAATGNLTKAIRDYAALGKQYPHRARIWNNLGVLYAREGKLGEARDALERAVARKANYTAAHENLGDVYVVLAAQAYSKAYALSAGDPEIAEKRKKLALVVPALPALAKRYSALSNGGSIVSRQDRDAIEKVLNRWANSQSSQSLFAYLSLYSNNFQPSGGGSLADWVRQQRKDFKSPASVSIVASSVRILGKGEDKAEAFFKLAGPQSGADRNAAHQMTLVRENGHWRIIKES